MYKILLILGHTVDNSAAQPNIILIFFNKKGITKQARKYRCPVDA